MSYYVILCHVNYYNCLYSVHRHVFPLAFRSKMSFLPDKSVKELRNASVRYERAPQCVLVPQSEIS